jgi:hypothetical protein
MFEILGQSTETCIGIKVSGKLDATDYGKLLPRLDQAIEAHGRISLVVVLEGFDGWAELDAAKADFQFGTTEYRSVKRCAFVSDKAWHKWVVRLMDPFTRRTSEEFFEPWQLGEAWAWACGDS